MGMLLFRCAVHIGIAWHALIRQLTSLPLPESALLAKEAPPSFLTQSSKFVCLFAAAAAAPPTSFGQRKYLLPRVHVPSHGVAKHWSCLASTYNMYRDAAQQARLRSPLQLLDFNFVGL